jgi:hypothetical protein
MEMDGAPYTGDLDLAAVYTRDDLLALLRTVYIRADKPSLRTLEAKTRHSASPLSKTAVAEMLNGRRFPRKAVTVAFVRACGVPDDALEPWQRAWERVVTSEQEPAQSRAAKAVPSRQLHAVVAGQHPLPGTLPSSPAASGGMQAQNVPADPPSGALAAAEHEIRQLREQVDQLNAENEKLRLRLAKEPDSPSPQVPPVDQESLLKEISALRSLLASVAESAAESVVPGVEQALQSAQFPDKVADAVAISLKSATPESAFDVLIRASIGTLLNEHGEVSVPRLLREVTHRLPDASHSAIASSLEELRQAGKVSWVGNDVMKAGVIRVHP